MPASTPDVVPGELAGVVAFAAFLGLVLLVAHILERISDARRGEVVQAKPAEPKPCHATACPYPATVLAQIIATGHVVWYCPGDFDRHAAHGTVRHFLAATDGVA